MERGAGGEGGSTHQSCGEIGTETSSGAAAASSGASQATAASSKSSGGSWGNSWSAGNKQPAGSTVLADSASNKEYAEPGILGKSRQKRMGGNREVVDMGEHGYWERNLCTLNVNGILGKQGGKNRKLHLLWKWKK